MRATAAVSLKWLGISRTTGLQLAQALNMIASEVFHIFSQPCVLFRSFSLRTTLCLQFAAQDIANAVLYLGAARKTP
jgi:hypothetical protein